MCNTLKRNFFWMQFYIFPYKCVSKYNFNRLVRILPGATVQDLGTSWMCNDENTLKLTVLEILDSVKYLPNGSAPHAGSAIKIKILRLCSSSEIVLI